MTTKQTTMAEGSSLAEILDFIPEDLSIAVDVNAILAKLEAKRKGSGSSATPLEVAAEESRLRERALAGTVQRLATALGFPLDTPIIAEAIDSKCDREAALRMFLEWGRGDLQRADSLLRAQFGTSENFQSLAEAVRSGGFRGRV